MENLNDLIIEHKRIVKVLDKKKPEELKREANIQRRELKNYIREKLKKKVK